MGASPQTRITDAAWVPYATLVAGVLCIGMAPIFVRLSGVTGDVSAFWRFAFGVLIISGPMIIVLRRGGELGIRGVLGWAVAAGVVFGLNVAVYNQAVTLTTAALATLLGNTAPIWVALGGWVLLKEPLSRTFWPGLGIAMVGVVVILGREALTGLTTANTGNLLAFAGSFGYAGYQLLNRRARKEMSLIPFIWVMTTMGALTLLLVTRVTGSPLIGLDPATYGWLFALGFISHTLGWLLLSVSFGRLPAALVSVSMLGQVVVAALLAAPILGEIPSVLQLIGGTVTLGGIALVHLGSHAQPEETEPVASHDLLENTTR